jgi:hypothetical protein
MSNATLNHQRHQVIFRLIRVGAMHAGYPKSSEQPCGTACRITEK